MIDETLDIARERLKAAAIELRMGRSLRSSFSAPPSRSRRCCSNLISNARDAIEALPEKRIRLTFETTESLLVIRVADSGRGIPLEVRDRMLDPFFTTKAPGKGTGSG
ncbi:MAG: ATP-binding protein [Myxococcales bacterium]